jgi:hypothetical protein
MSCGTKHKEAACESQYYHKNHSSHIIIISDKNSIVIGLSLVLA